MAKDISPPTQAPRSKRGAGKSTKPPAKSRKKKGAQIDTSAGADSHDDESDEDELDDDGSGRGKKGGKKLVWNEKLTWALITHINENAKIKRGLYPPPGQNPSTASGGGKPKSDFHSELAQALFDGHDKYGEEFAQANLIPAKLAKWAGKIKNRMNTLEKKTRHYFDLMGETGQGMTREDEIDMSTDSELTNKWRSIKIAFPYYFEMLELIGQRPNVIHAGVGNSLTEVDADVIMGRSAEQSLTDEDVHSNPPSPTSTRQLGVLPLSVSPPASPSPSLDDKASSRPSRKRSASFLGPSSDTDEEEADLLAASIQAQTAAIEKPKDAVATPKTAASKTSKSSKSSVVGPGKKTPAQPATSTPAPKGKGKASSKKLKFGDQFTEVVAAEEQTRQKELDVRLGRTELDKLKLEGKIAAKRDKIRYKAEMQKLAMRQEHEERMAKLGQRAGQRQGSDARAYPAASSEAGPGFSPQAIRPGPSNFWTGGGDEDYWKAPSFMGPPLGDPLADPLADPFTMGALGAENGVGGDNEQEMGRF